MRVLLAALLLIASTLPAFARDNEAWDASPDSVREWYRGLMRPDYPLSSCCGEADAYYADSFERDADGNTVAIITDERTIPNRPVIAPGTRIVVPTDKLKWDNGNPTGHGVIFIAPSGFVLCYVTPGGV